MLKKLWHSASAMTWAAIAVRLGGFAILLPLVLAYFSANEVILWLLFSAIASFQLVADFGFGQTFSREIAYGFVGRSLVDSHDSSLNQSSAIKENFLKPNWNSIQSAITVMSWLYLRFALLSLLLFGLFGTWAVFIPIENSDYPYLAWVSWIVVLFSTVISIYGTLYSTFLVGANRIDLQKRWETIVGCISLSAQVIVLIAGGGLLGLVLAAQLGLIIQILVNRSLCIHISDGQFKKNDDKNLDRRLLKAMWPAAWRTAIGSIVGIGMTRGMAIAMANLLVAAEAAPVLLALRVIQTISQISNVPFYTKIPEFNRIRASKKIRLLSEKSSKFMQLSLFLYVIGAIMIDLIVRQFLAFVGSETQFPDHLFWSTLVLAIFAERFGAMHIQLLLTSNKAIAHIANSISGVICIISMFALFPVIGVMAVPLSLLIANIGFYSWYTVIPTLQSISGISYFKYEARVALIPIILLISWIIYITKF